MNKQQARQIIKDTFESSFDKQKFKKFILDFLNHFEEDTFVHKGYNIPHSYDEYISSWQRVGIYSDGENRIDILIVNLKKETSLERARSRQRNFVAGYLQGKYGRTSEKEAALVAYISPNETDWRFSLVKMDYKFEKTKTGKVKVKEEFTPARRWSFLVGENEKSHTAQSRLVNILANDEQNPTLEEIENAFDIETVTKEFFFKYRELFLRTKEELDRVVKKDPKIKVDFEVKGVDTVNFAKKLLGQIVFLYFLQKKGWFGVGRDDDWGMGSKHFLRELFEKKHSDYKNFYNDILEPLFYEALRIDRSHDDGYYSRFDCKIPFLNGGLFDPIGNYDWVHTDIIIPDKLFSNYIKTKEGDIGNGILDVFDRYNFTVKEDEPLEKEVAIDPELLGKAYEKFNAIRPDNYDEFRKALKSGKTGEENKFNKKFGVYYTPREIVHYMCQQSLINYLHTELNRGTTSYQKIGEDQTDAFGNEAKVGQFDLTEEHKSNPMIAKKDIETLIHTGEQVSENEVAALIKEQNIKEGKQKTSGYELQLPKSIRNNSALIDKKLADITVCDPAVGSGAFPLGMMSEIIRARNVLSVFLNDNSRNAYEFKRRCIEHSLYGVDIDPGAVEIAKLRLWLSLVVDEDDIKNIKPLPNLDYKIVCGNSLVGVEKNLFNNELFNEMEKLKPMLFNETNPTKKQEYKKQIDKLISEITSGHTEFDFEVYFSEVFHNHGGFDVVIANPPYVGVKGHSDIFKPIKKGELGKFYSGRGELFYFFFHLSLNIGGNNSTIAFITTNYYPTATYGGLLRKDFKDRAKIVSLINFNELRIFESALGQHNMITILKKSNDDGIIAKNLITKNVGIANSNVLLEILYGKDHTTNYYTVAQSDIYEGDEHYIRLSGTSGEKNKINRILQKLLNNPLLGDICFVRQGLRTGIDKTTKSHSSNYGFDGDIGVGVFVVSKKELSNMNLNISEKCIPKKFYKNSNIAQYYAAKTTEHYVLYLNKTYNEKKLKREFPNIYAHLYKFKDLIFRIRNRNNERLENWINLDRTREQIIFTSNKIVAPQRSYVNTFGYNEGDWYASADVYYIIQNNEKYSLKYILSLLNSKMYYLWLYKRGKRKGEMLELYQKPLSEIPIKEISREDQEPFISLVDKILSITQSDDYLESTRKIAYVKVLEAEIDQLVYKLYNLTKEEIKIVKGENEIAD